MILGSIALGHNIPGAAIGSESVICGYNNVVASGNNKMCRPSVAIFRLCDELVTQSLLTSFLREHSNITKRGGVSGDE